MKHILFFCSILFIASCNNVVKQGVNKEYKSTPDSIIDPGNTNLIKELRTSEVKSSEYTKKIITSGVVKAIPNNYAEIASPFSGRITRSFVSLGQKVEIGSPVFEISSPVFHETGKIYYQSKQEMQLAEKNLKRQQDLFSNGVGTQKDLDEAEVTYELTKRDFENSIASLKVYNVDPDELVIGQPLIVRSPIRGEIVENNIVIGQYLKEDATPVAIVAELSKVWVIGQLKEKDIIAVHEGNDVGIRMTGMPDIPVSGKVFHIGEILDESTRSVQVYILCNNTERILKPGMFVTSVFSETVPDAIFVPANAIYQMEEGAFVFVSLGDNKYSKRKVELDGGDSNRVIIKAGIRPGEEIVTEGGSLLLDLKN